MSSNVLKALEAVLASNPRLLSPEAREHMLNHFAECEEAAGAFSQRVLKVQLDAVSSPLDAMLAGIEDMKAELSDHIMSVAVQRGLTVPPPGSDWVSLLDKDRPYHLEPVFVTDGKIIGISKYNAAYENLGRSPFQSIYDVCEWDSLGDITHFRRMTALALPDGSRMVEPPLQALPSGASKCPECNQGLHWHQMHGMRLASEVKHKGQVHRLYSARCPDCKTDYYVKVKK